MVATVLALLDISKFIEFSLNIETLIKVQMNTSYTSCIIQWLCDCVEIPIFWLCQITVLRAQEPPVFHRILQWVGNLPYFIFLKNFSFSFINRLIIPHQEYILWTWFLTIDIDLDHLPESVVRFLYCKVTPLLYLL